MMKKQLNLTELRQLNQNRTWDIACSPVEYLSIMNRERGDIEDPQLLAEIEIGLGRKYSNASKPTLALQHLAQGQKMLETLPKASQDPWWEGMMHHAYGNAYVEQLDFETALYHFFSSIKPFKPSGEISNEIKVKNGMLKIGHVMLRMGAGDEAIEYIKSAAANSENHPKIIVTAYRLMGIAYQAIGDFEQAKRYYDQYFRTIDNPYKMFASLTKAIACYIELGEIDEADTLLLRATALEEEGELNPKRKTNLLIGQAKVAAAKQDIELALSKCGEALAIANETNNLLNQAKVTLQQARLLLLNEQLDESQSLLEVFTKTKLSADTRGEANNLLLNIYKQTGQWEKAFWLISEMGETAIFTQSRLRSIEQLFDSRQHEQVLERKNAELVALNLEKDELFRIVAHDLNNPLSGALLTLNLLKRYISRYSTAKQQEMFDRMHNTLSSAVAIVSQLTTVAKAEADDGGEVLETVAADKVVAAVVAENIPLAQNKHQHLVVEQLTPVMVEVNQLWLKQILSNLVSNAIKYSPQGATTTVSMIVNRADTCVDIEVKDTGLGFSEDDLRHVFTKYKRLSAKPTGNESSTGLGLYIAKVLTEKMEGTISVASDGKNRGSTFVLTFPI